MIQHVREKFTCRDCEKISQAPAPFHVIAARLGRAQPAGDDPVREVRPASAAQPPEPSAMPGKACRSSLSTLADQVGAGCAVLRAASAAYRSPRPGGRTTAWRRHHRAGPGQGQDGHGAIWTYVRDDRPFGGHRTAGGAVLLLARSTARASQAASPTSPAFCRPTPIADTTSSTIPSRAQGAITAALCWAHARRQFFELADIAANARARKERSGDLAACARGGQAHRRAVRHRARHQRPERRRASARTPGTKRAPSGCSGSVAA